MREALSYDDQLRALIALRDAVANATSLDEVKTAVAGLADTLIRERREAIGTYLSDEDQAPGPVDYGPYSGDYLFEDAADEHSRID